MKKIIILTTIVLGVLALCFYAYISYLDYLDSFSRGDIGWFPNATHSLVYTNKQLIIT